MGWCCTALASRKMDKVEAACKETRNDVPGTSSNVFRIGDKCYFYEVSRRDQPDGGICGTIHLFTDVDGKPSREGNYARRVGTFKIDGQGKVTRGPAFWRAVS